jgi:hypothetical protein
MNKKGWLVQGIFGVVILFALVIVYSLTFMAQSSINDAIQLDESLSNQSKAIMQDSTTSYPTTFDGAIGFVAIILWIIVLGLSYAAKSNPLFLIVAVLVIASIGFVGMILSNVWSEIDNDADLNAFTNSFPISNFLLDNFLTYILIVFFSGVIVYTFSNGGYG